MIMGGLDSELIMNSHRIVTIAFSISMMLTAMSGCLSATDSEEPNPATELKDWNVYHAASISELPMCDGIHEGRLYLSLIHI